MKMISNQRRCIEEVAVEIRRKDCLSHNGIVSFSNQTILIFDREEMTFHLLEEAIGKKPYSFPNCRTHLAKILKLLRSVVCSKE